MKKIFRKIPASNSSKFEGSCDVDGDVVGDVVVDGDGKVDDDVVGDFTVDDDFVGVNHERSSN